MHAGIKWMDYGIIESIIGFYVEVSPVCNGQYVFMLACDLNVQITECSAARKNMMMKWIVYAQWLYGLWDRWRRTKVMW